MGRTGFVYDERCLAHDMGPHHPERPERLRAVKRAIDDAPLELASIEATPATAEDILRAHTDRHLVQVERYCSGVETSPDPDTPMMEASWEAAHVSAGGAIAACGAVLDGEVDHAFSALRPPGHHAEREVAMGFCLFNNVVIAARWAQAVRDVGKVAILDWDVHHGNGTQHMTYDDATLYYASIHQSPLYPGTGRPEERGANKTNLNVVMPPYAEKGRWIEALEQEILPELERFEPELLFISAGFDAHELDPLANQRLTADSYAAMTRMARPLAGGRIVSLLEGGYHLGALGESVVAHVRELGAA
jgi:acetoin utilization deacetylase AcuC-like enzyme